MSALTSNLAREPFRNRKPAVRLGALLWLLVLSSASWNVWQIWTAAQSRQAAEAELARLNAEIRSSRERRATLESDLLRADLRAANRRTEFLNHRIIERAFSFNQLLGELGRTLPRGVRLVRLVPEVLRESTGRAQRFPERIRLAFEGEAEDREQLLSWIDQLYADRLFERPVLERENVVGSGFIKFSGVVEVLPTQELLPQAAETLRASPPSADSKSPQPLGEAGGAEVQTTLAAQGLGTERRSSVKENPSSAIERSRDSEKKAFEVDSLTAATEPPVPRGAGSAETPPTSGSKSRTPREGEPSIFGVPMPLRRAASGS